MDVYIDSIEFNYVDITCVGDITPRKSVHVVSVDFTAHNGRGEFGGTLEISAVEYAEIDDIHEYVADEVRDMFYGKDGGIA